MTGGGIETWEAISRNHMELHRKYLDISPEQNILEIGCGIGRDAIQFSKYLSEKGQYTGIDIIWESINWCKLNISSRFPNFKFIYLDIYSQIHNPWGALQVTDIDLPVKDSTVDRIILHSVFTHMFFDDIVHYMKQFKRILKPSGKIYTSMFLVKNKTLALVRSGKTPCDLTFSHDFDEGCYVESLEAPEGAVAYSEKRFADMLSVSGLELDRDICWGSWTGQQGVVSGQDVVILRRVQAPNEGE